MVLTKIAIIAAAFAGLLGLARHELWFERAGLLSHCQVVASPYGAPREGQWWSCREGALSGFPNLRRDNCESKGFSGRIELWYCPIAIGRPTY